MALLRIEHRVCHTASSERVGEIEVQLLWRRSLALCFVVCGGYALADDASVSWPAYGGGPGGGHFTPASEITAQNVGGLQVAWSHHSGDVRAAGANMLNAEARSDQMPKSGFMAT